MKKEKEQAAPKKEEKEKSKGKKITEWIITGLLILLFLGVAIFQIDGLVHQNDNHGQKISFGFGNFVVETNSMEPEYPVGTAIVTKKKYTDKIAETYLEEKAAGKSNDEIHIDLTFYYGEPVNVKSGVDGKTDLVQALASAPITHRLINVIDNTVDTSRGKYIFILAGINTEAAEAYSAENQYQAIYGDAIYGQVIINSPALGGFLSFVASPWGLIILLLIPVIYLVISFGVDAYHKLKEIDEEEASEQQKKDLEAGAKIDASKPNSADIALNESKEPSKTSSTPSTDKSSDDPLAGLSEEDKERLKQEMLAEMLEEQEKKGK